MLADANGFEADVVAKAQPGADKAGQTIGTTLSTGLKATLTTGVKDLLSAGFWAGIGLEAGKQALGLLETGIKDVIGAIPNAVSQGEAFANTVEEITSASGASAEQASRFAGTLQYLGLSTSGLGTNMKTLATQAVNNQAEFEKLGIAIRGPNGQMLDTLTILDNVRSYLSKTGDATTNLALAQKLLGRGAADLAQYFDLTDAEALALDSTMDKLGVTIGADALTNIVSMQRESNLLGLAWQGLDNVLTAGLAPTFRQVIGEITTLVEANLPAIRQTIVDVSNAVAGLVSGLLGNPSITPFQLQLDQIGSSATGGAASFDEWAQQMGYTIPVINTTKDATKAATDAVTAQTTAVDKEIAEEKAQDAAAEKIYQNTMTRLASQYTAGLAALDLQEKQLALEDQEKANAEALAQAQLDLAAAQSKIRTDQLTGVATSTVPADVITYLADQLAVAKASQAVTDAKQKQTDDAAQAARDADRQRLTDQQAYLSDLAKLETSATNRTALAKTLSLREQKVEQEAATAKADGDAQSSADLAVKLEALKTTAARNQAAIRNADQDTALNTVKTQLAAQKAAISDSDSATETANKAKLAELKKEYQTYLEGITKDTDTSSDYVSRHILGSPTDGTGLGGALTKSFTDGETAGEDFRTWLTGKLIPGLQGVVDLLNFDTSKPNTLGSLLGLYTLSKLMPAITAVAGAGGEAVTGAAPAITAVAGAGGAAVIGAAAGAALTAAGDVAPGQNKGAGQKDINYLRTLKASAAYPWDIFGDYNGQGLLKRGMTNAQAIAALIAAGYGKAAGGPTLPGSMYVINEGTPFEGLWSPRYPGSVVPAGPMAAALAGATAGFGAGGDGQPAIIRVEAGGNPLLDYIDRGLRYRRR